MHPASNLRIPLTRQSLDWAAKTARRVATESGGHHGHGDDEDRQADTHFGFEAVTEEEKAAKVFGVFHKVAGKYDLMNDAMSLGIHRQWKDTFLDRLDPSPNTELLDVAGGTGIMASRKKDVHLVTEKLSNLDLILRKQGDIAFRFLDRTRHSKDANVTVCDINPSMLAVGKQRAQEKRLQEQRIKWREGDAQKLPFDNETFDAYTIAFGIRNVVRMEEALLEAHRVLRQGGRFLCLEFGHVDNPVLSSMYDAYSFQVIPPLGKVLAGDWKSYQYLVESIRKFPPQQQFKEMIEEAGFRAVTYENLLFGIAAIHSGFKL